MGAFMGSKPSSTVATRALCIAEFNHSIIRDIATRNGHDAALGHNAATESHVECAITGDYATGHRDCSPIGIYTAATRSAVARDHAPGELECGTFVLLDAKFDACATARRGCTANVATAHIDGRAVLGIDEAADFAALFLRNSATYEVKRAMLVNVNEPHRGVLGDSNNCALNSRRVLIDLLGGTCTTCSRFGYVIGKVSRNAIIVIRHLCRLAIIVRRQMLVLILQLLAVDNILLNVPRVHVVHDRKRRALSNIKQRLASTILLYLVTI